MNFNQLLVLITFLQCSSAFRYPPLFLFPADTFDQIVSSEVRNLEDKLPLPMTTNPTKIARAKVAEEFFNLQMGIFGKLNRLKGISLSWYFKS